MNLSIKKTTEETISINVNVGDCFNRNGIYIRIVSDDTAAFVYSSDDVSLYPTYTLNEKDVANPISTAEFLAATKHIIEQHEKTTLEELSVLKREN